MKKDYFKSKLITNPHYLLGGNDDPIGDDDEVEEKDDDASTGDMIAMLIKVWFPWSV